MTARQVYEAVLIEMNKVQAPSLLLEDFNYLFNKAINQYINKKYNIYDVSQQTTDDLRVLKSSVTLQALNEKSPVNTVTKRDSLYGAIYEFSLPADYLHLLNCVCNFRVNKPFKCYNAGTFVQFPATRLTADMWSQIINNFYMRPMYKRPYYYIHNVNSPMAVNKDTWKSESPTGWQIGTKDEYNGDFGREPSTQINLPTDPGNRDIQHLEQLEGIGSRFDTVYIDDNNHYGTNRKYGIPRYIEFSNAEVQDNGGLWVRTGKAKIVNSNNTSEVLANPTFTVNVNASGAETSISNLRANWDSAVVLMNADQTSAYLNGLVHGAMNETYSNIKLTRIVPNSDPDENVVVNAKIIYEWKPVLQVLKLDSVEKVGEVRYGNPSTVRLEIRDFKIFNHNMLINSHFFV